MNLIYKILWFEDEILWAQPLVLDIKSYVEDMGFKFEEPQFEKDNTHIEEIKFENFDLILMDYKLSSGENGDVLINKIRNHNFFSELVFYSSSGVQQLRELVQQKELDGVYCVNRDANQFIPKVQDVIKATVKKVLDSTTMRGIVMMKTSDIDEKMIDIISLYVNTLSDSEGIAFLEGRRKKLIKSLCDKIVALEKEDVNKFICNWLFDSTHKWRSVLEIVKKEFPANGPIIKEYEEKIIKMRNCLAHAKEIIDSDGNKYLADNDFIFNDEKYKEILNDLKKQEKNIEDILKILASK
jgi:hypothetical protein